ncbi:MAG: Flp family type IVb pilin [Desulfotomaculales bacterium]
MLEKVKKILRDEKGYEMAELLVIVAVLGVLATAVLGTMKGGLNTAANQVGSKVNDIINSWTTNP